MAQTLPMTSVVRMHISLNVGDIDRSVAFYKVLFGREPAKHYQNYAKFELEEPPVVLSLAPVEPSGEGTLNHLGFRMPDSASLVAMQERLERAGIRSRREEGVECCYALQTKFWVTDPDGTLWEIYTFESDLDHHGRGQTREEMLPFQNQAEAPVKATWEHRMGDPIPERIPHADGSLDEVSLRGTLNLDIDEPTAKRLVADAYRALRPGGKLFVHVLTAEGVLPAAPELPGPASKVRHTPLEHVPPQLLQDAGYVDVEMVKFDAKPCFVQHGVGLRELQLIGFRPAEDDAGATRTVLYKGPFRQFTDDRGRVYPRGQRVKVPAKVAAALGNGPAAKHFTIFEK